MTTEAAARSRFAPWWLFVSGGNPSHRGEQRGAQGLRLLKAVHVQVDVLSFGALLLQARTGSP